MDNDDRIVRHIYYKLCNVLNVGCELPNILGTIMKDLLVWLVPALNYKKLKILLTKKFKSLGLLINPGLITNDANQPTKVNKANTEIK